MSSRSCRRVASNRVAVALVLATAGVASAQSFVGATGGEWGTASNWNPASVPNAVDAAVSINSALTVNVSDTGTGGTYPYTFGTLSTSLASGSVVIGTTAGTTDVLRAQVSTGQPVITVTNSAASIFFYANLEGTHGFRKAGAGKLTFRFNASDHTYSGNIGIDAGILGIERNSSLGDDNNDIFIANGARLLAEPGSNSGTITLPSSRIIMLTGAQSQIGANNANVNLVIDGNIIEDAAGRGLVKTDAGKVTLNGTLGYTGETRLAGGTLALSGPALLPSGQNLRFNQPAVATLDVGSTHQTVRTIVMDNTTANRVITGSAGSLTVNGDANLAMGASNNVNYDFAGLGAFTFDRANRNFVFNLVNVAATTNIADLNLARSGASGGVNTITANQITFGGGNSDGNNGNTARVKLGTTNTFNANTIAIGAFNAGGIVDFAPGLTNPSLKIRGTDTTSPASLVTVGETSSGSRRGEGVLNLTGGSLDAQITNLKIGRHVAGANNADTSTLTMPAGTLVASTITLAEKVNTGAPTLTSTFNQSGGSVSAGLLLLGIDTGAGTAVLKPTYNLTGGTLRASVIDGGVGAFAATSARTLNISGGTLANLAGSDLTVDGADNTAAGIVSVVIGANNATFDVEPSKKMLFTSTAPISGSGSVIKTGDGTLLIDGSASVAMSITDGLLGGNGTISNAVIVDSSAGIAPGSSIGTLTVASVDLNGTLVIELEDTTVGDANGLSDVLNVTGNLDLTGAKLSLVDVTSPGPSNFDDSAYVIARYDSLTNTFASVTGLPAGRRLDYNYLGLKQIAVIPEPATLGAIALTGLALLRRR